MQRTGESDLTYAMTEVPIKYEIKSLLYLICSEHIDEYFSIKANRIKQKIISWSLQNVENIFSSKNAIFLWVISLQMNCDQIAGRFSHFTYSAYW